MTYEEAKKRMDRLDNTVEHMPLILAIPFYFFCAFVLEYEVRHYVKGVHK